MTSETVNFFIKLQANIALDFLTIDSEYIAICLVYLSDIHISLNRSFFCLLIYNNNPSSATHFSETIKLDITGESFAQQTIYMKCWILISLKKNVNISSAAVVIGTVRDNIDYFVFIPYTTFQVTPLRWWFLRESFCTMYNTAWAEIPYIFQILVCLNSFWYLT